MPTSKTTDILAPFEIWEVPLDDRTIKFKQPLVLTPAWMPHDPEEPGDIDYLEVEVPELGISAFGEDRRELESCVYGDIRFAWRHHVLANDASLLREARTIKNNYLAIAEVVDE